MYAKVRKRQYWKIWQTQFVPLCSEEVKRLKSLEFESPSSTHESHIESFLEEVQDVMMLT